ncbi:hypothetical protein [Rubritalea tangerina]|uniref:hypothetical protein n=1 Tax=Rubritalea tangerina TaxID=430798 RepID=UPI003623DE4A
MPCGNCPHSEEGVVNRWAVSEMGGLYFAAIVVCGVVLSVFLKIVELVGAAAEGFC